MVIEAPAVAENLQDPCKASCFCSCYVFDDDDAFVVVVIVVFLSLPLFLLLPWSWSLLLLLCCSFVEGNSFSLCACLQEDELDDDAEAEDVSDRNQQHLSSLILLQAPPSPNQPNKPEHASAGTRTG